ncbi:MAG: hypothetical protein JEZ09_18570 [Salinivirgaceae bacterium]|nr:hypothetical protein [Salinivirgaceae bacterium]
MYKKIKKYSILACILFFVSCTPKTLTFFGQLQELPGVISVDSIELDTNFVQQYELYFEQALDHKNPKLGTFKQRVILSHADTAQPVVAVLEGYRIWSGKSEELTNLLKGNQINIEHRFFKDSRPDSIPWDKLTIWQAATDQHKIINALKELYQGKWVSTGISKGGQATMFHRYFYPNDVDAGVAYVAPLNFEREDPRIYEFLATVGTDEDRARIYDFQCLCFENFDELKALLSKKSEEENWSFEFGFKKALEYTILEYSFAFWQWGKYTSDQIPLNADSAQVLFNHLNDVAGFTFFEDKSVEENRPFFWAALTELGIYGYETSQFSKYLGDTTNYTFDFTAPKGIHPTFDTTKMRKVKEFLDSDVDHMLYITGGLDTWGATSYVPEGKNISVKIALSDGHHGTRIRDFEKMYREYTYRLLEEWLEVEIEDIYDGE